jgi:hypothetical protein
LLGDTNPHVLRPDDRAVLADVRFSILEYELHEVTRSCGKTLILGWQRSRKNPIRVLIDHCKLISIVLQARIWIGRCSHDSQANVKSWHPH